MCVLGMCFFVISVFCVFFFFFSSRRRHTRYIGDWSSDVYSSDLLGLGAGAAVAYVVVAQIAFGRGLILPVTVPLIGLAVALVGALLVHWLTASVERAQTRDL